MQDDPVLLEVHVFQTKIFGGEAIETEEMRPQWFPESQVACNLVKFNASKIAVLFAMFPSQYHFSVELKIFFCSKWH
jgi:hypothetical protein